MTLSKRRRHNHNQTSKSKQNRHNPNNGAHNQSILQIAQMLIPYFLETLNTIKLYHWKTHCYATHKATDDLYGTLNGNIDSFVEVLLGKCNGARMDLTMRKHIALSDFTGITGFTNTIITFRNALVSLSNYYQIKSPFNADLLTIRDELLANVNKFLYLLTFT